MYEQSYDILIEAVNEFHDIMPNLNISEVHTCACGVNLYATDGHIYQFDNISGALWRLPKNWRIGKRILVNGGND